MIIIIAISLSLFEHAKYSKLFEILFFMPYVTNTISICIVFRYIFDGQYEILNSLLKLFHLGTPNWLDDPAMNMITVIIFGIWLSLAFNIIILMSALRRIHPQHYKVVKMFGASSWEVFKKSNNNDHLGFYYYLKYHHCFPIYIYDLRKFNVFSKNYQYSSYDYFSSSSF